MILIRDGRVKIFVFVLILAAVSYRSRSVRFEKKSEEDFPIFVGAFQRNVNIKFVRSRVSTSKAPSSRCFRFSNKVLSFIETK